MTSEAERRFHADMVSGAARLKREINYNPTRFMQMVGEHGGVAEARRRESIRRWRTATFPTLRRRKCLGFRLGFQDV
jgi:hypothetical protein